MEASAPSDAVRTRGNATPRGCAKGAARSRSARRSTERRDVRWAEGHPPTDPAVDPPPYHCYNYRQHGHDMPRCLRPKVREFCNNCGRHGVDLRDCPRCSAAHQRFVRANFANEQEMAEEIERRNREVLHLEEERREFFGICNIISRISILGGFSGR